jgi:asparagine synthase (glutamine-hydrolysing)
MCGIWAYICDNINETNSSLFFNNFMKLKHRGPDFSNFQIYQNLMIGFHRLSIMDLSFTSNQPYILFKEKKTIIFICNGEIYNYKELIDKYKLDINNKSDCLTIPHLYLNFEYNEWLTLFTDNIKGEYAFLLFEFNDNKLTNTVIGRDTVGIRPLYWNKTNNNYLFSSEIKGCHLPVKEFNCGHVVKINHINNTSNIFDFRQIYNTKQIKQSDQFYLDNVKNSVINSIKRRLDSDQPIAFLLSGGVDSSIVASIASKLSNKQIRTFCCGMNHGSDLKYAKMVSQHINSIHTEVIFTEQEALETIDDVIYTIETWDTTTIRASVGQYLVSKYISQNTDAKVLFVGEGPDEVCSSYLFNWYAPDPNLIHTSAIEYVSNIHFYDVKRSDRCISKWGLEARVALLDPEFITAYWEIPSEERYPKTRGIEKWWFRKAFDSNYLPEEVLWRKKEAFSDGVSSTEKSWYQIIQEYIKLNFNMSEEEYYKKKFIEYFGEIQLNVIPKYWQPKWNKYGYEIKEYIDPSARTLDIYSTNINVDNMDLNH